MDNSYFILRKQRSNRSERDFKICLKYSEIKEEREPMKNKDFMRETHTHRDVFERNQMEILEIKIVNEIFKILIATLNSRPTKRPNQTGGELRMSAALIHQRR